MLLSALQAPCRSLCACIPMAGLCGSSLHLLTVLASHGADKRFAVLIRCALFAWDSWPRVSMDDLLRICPTVVARLATLGPRACPKISMDQAKLQAQVQEMARMMTQEHVYSLKARKAFAPDTGAGNAAATALSSGDAAPASIQQCIDDIENRLLRQARGIPPTSSTARMAAIEEKLEDISGYIASNKLDHLIGTEDGDDKKTEPPSPGGFRRYPLANPMQTVQPSMPPLSFTS